MILVQNQNEFGCSVKIVQVDCWIGFLARGLKSMWYECLTQKNCIDYDCDKIELQMDVLQIVYSEIYFIQGDFILHFERLDYMIARNGE